MVEMQYDRSQLIDALDRCNADETGTPSVSLLETEEEVFGANHQDFGKGLCEKWKFPAPFVAAAGFHHNPTEAPSEARKIVYVVHAADKIASMIDGGFKLDNPSCEIQKEVMEELGITDAMVTDMIEKLIEAVNEASEI
jgi:HD-like signal output (HDOD) protein